MKLPSVIFDPDEETPEEHRRQMVRVFGWPIPPDGIKVSEDGDTRVVTISLRNSDSIVFFCWALLVILVFSADLVKFTSWAEWLAVITIVSFATWVGCWRYWGTVSIRSDGDLIAISEGIGSFRRRSQFALKDLRSLHRRSRPSGRAGRKTWLELRADREIEFGALLRPEQMHYVIGFLLDEARRAA